MEYGHAAGGTSNEGVMLLRHIRVCLHAGRPLSTTGITNRSI